MRHLWFASLLIFALGNVSCSKKFHFAAMGTLASPPDSISVFTLWQKTDTSASVYKFIASATIYGKKVEGILFLRRMSNDFFRATFLAKGALKLFDMELYKDTFIVRKHAYQLSNQMALNVLAKDMTLLTLQLNEQFKPLEMRVNEASKTRVLKRQVKSFYLFYSFQNEQLVQLLKTDLREKLDTQLSFSDYQKHHPTKISLKHSRFRMQIDLTLLQE